MRNILVISPPSIAGTLIIKGFSKAFEDLGHNVLLSDVRELAEESVSKFSPDMVFCYDYGHFSYPEAERIVSGLNIPIIHYFADEPRSNFAHSGNLESIDKIEKTDNIIFCWDKNFLDQLKNKSYYLPLGADPELYTVTNKKIETKYDITFIGRPLTLKRLKFLAAIVKNFPGRLSIFSFKKHFEKSIQDMLEYKLLTEDNLFNYKSSYKGFLKSEKELGKIYKSSKINLNITEQGITCMNYRVLEVLASKGFLLTDFMEDTVKYFTEDTDLSIYRDEEDLISKIHFYLNNDELRNIISLNGFKKAIENHTFILRASVILAKI